MGEFKDDDFHGLGTYIFPDGDVFRGYFQNGKWNGLGLYMFGSTGTAKVMSSGVYRDGSINGEGVYLFNSDGEWAGDIFAGNHKDGLAEGLGAYFYSDGAKFIGLYGDDVERPGHALFRRRHQQGRHLENGEMQSRTMPSQAMTAMTATTHPSLMRPDAVVSASSAAVLPCPMTVSLSQITYVIDSCQEVYIHHEGQKYPARPSPMTRIMTLLC